MKTITKLLIITMLFTTISAENKRERRFFEPSNSAFSMSYSQRVLFYNDSRFSKITPDGYALLDSPIRMHGGRFQGKLTHFLTIGLSAYGALDETENDSTYTTYWGALAGFFAELRKTILNERITFLATFILSCGQFSFSTINNSGSGVYGFTNAFYFEPGIGIDIKLFRPLFFQCNYSYIVADAGTTNWYNGGDGESLSPFGHNIAFYLTYFFPKQKKRFPIKTLQLFSGNSL